MTNKSGPTNTHSTVSRFSTDKFSHLSYDITGYLKVWWMGQFICKKVRHHWISIGWFRFKMCLCTHDIFTSTDTENMLRDILLLSLGLKLNKLVAKSNYMS
jgi:hypothetical protein